MGDSIVRINLTARHQFNCCFMSEPRIIPQRLPTITNTIKQMFAWLLIIKCAILICSESFVTCMLPRSLRVLIKRERIPLKLSIKLKLEHWKFQSHLAFPSRANIDIASTTTHLLYASTYRMFQASQHFLCFL